MGTGFPKCSQLAKRDSFKKRETGGLLVGRLPGGILFYRFRLPCVSRLTESDRPSTGTEVTISDITKHFKSLEGREGAQHRFPLPAPMLCRISILEGELPWAHRTTSRQTGASPPFPPG